MASSSPKIEVKNLYKVFGDNSEKIKKYLDKGYSREKIMDKTGQVVALRDINLKLKQGEIFVIMGLSGSGKSTLIRCINRLHSITSGSVLVDGTDIAKVSSKELRNLRRKKFGMVFQHFSLFPHRTVLENVAFGLEIQGISKKERLKKAAKVLKTVGLKGWGNKKTGELSGGMQQRVGLARALAADPDILLMDEPFSALDPLIRSNLQDELLRLHNEMKKTILFITHDLNEAIKVGDRIAILDSEGKIVQVDIPEKILLKPANEYVERFLGDVDRPAVIRIESVMKKPTKLKSLEDADHIVHRIKTVKSILPYVLSTEREVAVVDDSNKLIGEISKKEIARILKKYEE